MKYLIISHMQNKLTFAKGTKIKKGSKIGDVGGTPNYGIHVHIGMSDTPSLSSFFTSEFDGKHNPEEFRKKVNISGLQMENTFGYGEFDAQHYPNSNHNGIDDGNVSEGSDITYDTDIEVMECGYHVNTNGNGGFGNYIIFKEVESSSSFGSVNNAYQIIWNLNGVNYTRYLPESRGHHNNSNFKNVTMEITVDMESFLYIDKEFKKEDKNFKVKKGDKLIGIFLG